MEEQKRKYYLNIESGEVLDEPAEPEGHFTLYATGEEIKHLRESLAENYQADLKTFGRAHIPFKEYHKDKENVEYDNTMKEIYAMIYELGDQEAKNHVLSMGILDESKLNR
ncbi:hydrolase [Bacillus sp. REN3]|uniref:hydrolase n=1 Tax=Bacillus sp. REN3 TaxID=2802440 RepID=UPI001AEE846C|nr:hydrolase [Bacillus sp. REN3]